LHTKIGKLVSEIPETHLPSDFWVKMGAIDSLVKSAKSMQFVKITVSFDLLTPSGINGALNLNFINSSSEGSTKIGMLIAIGPKNLCTKFQLSSGAIAGQNSHWNALEMECRQSVSHISPPPPSPWRRESHFGPPPPTPLPLAGTL